MKTEEEVRKELATPFPNEQFQYDYNEGFEDGYKKALEWVLSANKSNE